VGMFGVGVCVSVAGSVAGFVTVGNGLGADKVGKGVNVSKPKLNNAVGVIPMTALGKTFGLGVFSEELRDLSGNKLSRIEHRKQRKSRNKPGTSILPVQPCWL